MKTPMKRVYSYTFWYLMEIKFKKNKNCKCIMFQFMIKLIEIVNRSKFHQHKIQS